MTWYLNEFHAFACSSDKQKSEVENSQDGKIGMECWSVKS